MRHITLLLLLTGSIFQLHAQDPQKVAISTTGCTVEVFCLPGRFDVYDLEMVLPYMRMIVKRLGAFDYIQKPFTVQELLVKVGKAVESRRLAGEVALLTREFQDRYKFENIVGRSAAIRDVLGRIVRVDPTDTIVLITGASGTGKELVAKAIHANSKRRTGRSSRSTAPPSRRRCSRASSSATHEARSPAS